VKKFKDVIVAKLKLCRFTCIMYYSNCLTLHACLI